MTADLWAWHRHLHRTVPTRILTLEGHDGSGKSTLAARLEEQLRADGYKVIALGEPGRISPASALLLRDLDPQADTWISQSAQARADLRALQGRHQAEELRLFEQARYASAQLENLWLSHPGHLIVKDRCWLSSLTHQQETNLSAVLPPEDRWPELEHLAQAGERVLLLTVTPEFQRNEDPNEALDFSTQQTRQAYQDTVWLGIEPEPHNHIQFSGLQLAQARLYWSYQAITPVLS